MGDYCVTGLTLFDGPDMKSRLPAFEVLVDMARNDPQGLESLRVSLTEAVINGVEDERKRKRLQGLQFRVDLERQRARTPLAACIRVSEMMCQSLAELHRSMVTPMEDNVDVSPRAGGAVVLAFAGPKA